MFHLVGFEVKFIKKIWIVFKVFGMKKKIGMENFWTGSSTFEFNNLPIAIFRVSLPNQEKKQYIIV